MKLKLKELTRRNVEQVRQWRNECLEALRTPFLLTEDMQQRFYDDIINNRNARARYWGVWITIEPPDEHPEFTPYDAFIGMIGLENIEWENRRAEISIILSPNFRGKGYGEQAIDLLLEQGFMYLNLENIWGEVYSCNEATAFWAKILKKYNGDCAILPRTKYWDGKYYDSAFFNIKKEEWLKCQK